ncbi:hypothetical protein CEXT_597141 [Caerostris extrusa]|uniref:Uncharacterized protein n=1 Tax=Caerostris extrusa TaxID=172846 RepID=A0AAV4U8H2_CAEEX|nr:hypothetical protein CEXT_597141 [Caerostris extrusa]
MTLKKFRSHSKEPAETANRRTLSRKYIFVFPTFESASNARCSSIDKRDWNSWKEGKEKKKVLEGDFPRTDTPTITLQNRGRTVSSLRKGPLNVNTQLWGGEGRGPESGPRQKREGGEWHYLFSGSSLRIC